MKSIEESISKGYIIIAITLKRSYIYYKGVIGKLNGFHANDTLRCEKFLSDYNYLIISHDTEFLGNGMYFWEHKSRAEWWLKEKHKEVIVSAEIITDNLLDLKDPEVCSRIQHLYERMGNAVKNRYIRKYPNMDIQTGVKLNVLFEMYSKYMEIFKVIRSTRIYDIEESLFLANSKLSSRAVDIYCIKTPEVVTKRVRV